MLELPGSKGDVAPRPSCGVSDSGSGNLERRFGAGRDRRALGQVASSTRIRDRPVCSMVAFDRCVARSSGGGGARRRRTRGSSRGRRIHDARARRQGRRGSPIQPTRGAGCRSARPPGDVTQSSDDERARVPVRDAVSGFVVRLDSGPQGRQRTDASRGRRPVVQRVGRPTDGRRAFENGGRRPEAHPLIVTRWRVMPRRLIRGRFANTLGPSRSRRPFTEGASYARRAGSCKAGMIHRRNFSSTFESPPDKPTEHIETRARAGSRGPAGAARPPRARRRPRCRSRSIPSGVVNTRTAARGTWEAARARR